MLTREQWGNLARFAGFIPLNCMCVDLDDNTIGIQVQREKNGRAFDWTPLTDWNDFGPLWVMLVRWKAKGGMAAIVHPIIYKKVVALAIVFSDIANEDHRTEQELMQAGCELAAQIGATTTKASAGEKS